MKLIKKLHSNKRKMQLFLVPLFAILIVLAVFSTSWAATYYVDAVNGNDNNSGLYLSSAWKTVGKVNASKLNPGDQVLFRSGQIWRESLAPSSSGLSGSVILFSSYGDGAVPIISGAEYINNWRLHTGMIYEAICPFSTDTLWEDDQYLEMKSSISSIAIPGNWYRDPVTNSLYLWPLNNDNPNIHKIEAAKRNNCVNLDSKSHIVFDNLILEKSRGTTQGIFQANNTSSIKLTHVTVRFSGYQAYGVKFTGGVHNTVEDCVVHDTRNDGIYFREKSTYPVVRRTVVYNAGNNSDNGDNGGICFGGPTGGCHYGLIEYCHVYNIGGQDSVNSHNQAIVIDRSNSCVIRYNKIHDCTKGGIGVGGEVGNHVNNVEIYVNLIFDINAKLYAHKGFGPGIGLWNVDNAKLYNNTVWNIGSSGWCNQVVYIDGTSGETLTNIDIKNNIIGPSLGGMYRGNYALCQNTFCINLLSDNNLFYDPNGLILQKGQNSYTTLPGFINAMLPNEMKSIEADPRFIDVGSQNFHLLADSPCIDTGEKVSIIQDIDGIQVPQGRAVDIGAFEFKNIFPPSNLRIK